MEYRVLGPLEVLDRNGRRLAVGGPRQQSVLALLLLRAEQTVALDRLVDELWERPPATAARTVQVYVSRLRHELPDGAIQSRPGGYTFVLDGAELDLETFEGRAGEGHAALAAGKYEAAARLLREALALWRGPALAGLGSETLRREADRLETLRLSVLEDRIQADLGSARHGEIVPELTVLVAEHPLRERFRAQLMRALYRSGRPSDALALYRDGRRLLVEELGMEPGQELRELEQAILRQDAELEAPELKPRAASGSRVQAQGLPAAQDELAAEEGATRRRAHAGLVLIGSAIGAAALVATAGILTRGASSVAVAANSIAVIDPRTNDVIADARGVGTHPDKIVVTKSAVWVLSSHDQTLAQINPRTKRIVGQPHGLGVKPTDIAVGDGAVWVAGGQSGVVLRIDPTSPSAQERITVPHIFGYPTIASIAVAPGGVWVYDEEQRALFRFDPLKDKFTKTIQGIAASPSAISVLDEQVFYLKSAGLNYPAAIAVDVATSSSTPVARLPGPGSALAVGRGAIVWVTVPLVKKVLGYESASSAPLATAPTGTAPSAIALGGNSVWVANAGPPGTVMRVEAASGTLLGTVSTGLRPTAIAVGNGDVWVGVAGR